MKKTRYSVQRAMEVLNYQPNANAQALAVQNTDTIGVVVTDVTDPFLLSWSNQSIKWLKSIKNDFDRYWLSPC